MSADPKTEEALLIGRRIKEYRRANGLTQEQLAQSTGIPYTTLTKIESGAIKNPSLNTIAKIARTLKTSLDDFLITETFRGENSVLQIYEDALSSMHDGDEMYISGIDERRYLAANEKAILDFIEGLKNRGITQKLLSCEGDYFQLEGEHLEYRWIPEKYFNPTPIYSYADRVATIIWSPVQHVVILRNQTLADAYKKQFLFMWEKARKIPKKKR